MLIFIIRNKTALTEHSASGNRFSVQPEGDLRQNDSHDAREVGLNHKIANFPFQMEICCHHYIFAWVRGGKQRETHGGQRGKSRNIHPWRHSSSITKSWKRNKENSWKLSLGMETNEVLENCLVRIYHMLENLPKRCDNRQFSFKKYNQIATFPTFLTLPLRDAACSFMTLDSENRPWAPALLCHVRNLCSKDMRKTFCHSPRCFFSFFFFFAGKIQTEAEMAPTALKFIENMIYLQAPAGPVWEGHVASILDSITCTGSVIFLRNAPVIKWSWYKGHCKAQISSKGALRRDVNAIKSITFTASLPSWCPLHLRESWLTSRESVNLSNVRSTLLQHVQTFRGNDQISSAPLPAPKLQLH